MTDKYAKLREVAEKATPGPWERCYHLRSPEHDASCSCGYRGSIWSGDGEYIIVEMGSSPDVDEAGQVQGHTQPQAERSQQLSDAAFIAAFNPQTVLALLDLLAAEKARADAAEATISTLTEQLAEARAREAEARVALKPLAYLLDAVELMGGPSRLTNDDDTLYQCHSSVVGPRSITLGDMRLARATLSRLEKQEGEK